MKTKYLLLGAIFAFLSLGVRAQISQMLYQGFESDETVKYSGNSTDGVRMSSSIVMSGSRALKLVQQSDQDVEIVFDTMDFTKDLTLKYIALEFDHICLVKTNGSLDINMGTIYWKRTNQTSWTKLSGQEYDLQDYTASSQFSSTGCFNENSYLDAWKNGGDASNEMWKHERFNLNNMLPATLAASDRKLQIKFVLKKRTLTTPLDTLNCAWWIDNIRVSSSAEQMINPKIKMWLYPHAEAYANSRGARVQLDATTVVSAGINPDSVYLCYKVGSDPSVNKVIMDHISGTRYGAFIPFFGYDTAMSFYCVVRDATGNENTATFPPAINSWCDYHYVRGINQLGVKGEGFDGTKSYSGFIFSSESDHRCQFVYDSALLAGAGYGVGSITKLKFVSAAATTATDTRKNFQIRMKNVPTTYISGDDDAGSYYFDNSDMTVVYNDSYTLPILNVDDTFTIDLQDTFFYAGKNIMMQVWYDDDTDHKGLGLRMIPAQKNNYSSFTTGHDAAMGSNAFTSSDFISENASNTHEERPVIIFYEEQNQPLYYDAGISELTTPNYYVAMEKSVGLVRVKLNNFGANSFDSVRVSYMIDDTIFGHSDYLKTLNGLSSTSFDIASGIDIPAGFHKLTVWVEDSVKANGVNIRDHEPFNDTMFSEFIVCDGPMNGVKNIGGSNPHFNDIEEFLFSLSRCGIDDSLIVRLSPGNYPPFVMPSVTGLSENHYIVFESMDSIHATLYSDESTANGSIVNIESVANMKFRNLNFVRRGGLLDNMVKMSSTSVNCTFEGCSFIDSVDNPAGAMRIAAMIDNYTAQNLYVDKCTFIGGRMGVSINGESSLNHSKNAYVKNCLFRDQNENAVRVENMTDVYVEENEMYNVSTNASSVLLVNSIDGNISIQRNKMYTTHGAGALTVSSAKGTADNHIIIANNMMVGDDDGNSAQMNSLVSIINATYTDFVYNSTKLTAYMRLNVPAISFGSNVNYCRFINNVVASMDSTNYALGYTPGTVTTNTLGHNVYYSGGTVLNRYNGASYNTIEDWKKYAVSEDTTSLSVAPNFLNASLVDLRTFNRQMKDKGVPLDEVLIDMFGNERGTETTCPGAFEFSALPFDFELTALLNPVDNCYMPEQAEMVFILQNNGVSSLPADTTVKVSISWTINGKSEESYEVSTMIPAEDTVAIYTGHYVQMPSNGTMDSHYVVHAWTSFDADLNNTNDTTDFRVVSRYHASAPDSTHHVIEYATKDTIVPQGINMWSVYENSSAPKRRSQIYWYIDSNSIEPFYIGDTLITGEIRNDTAFYVKQRRDMPMVRFTQVELVQTSNALGLTSPMPYWMDGLRKVAIQITNVGDYPANLKGDSLIMVATTTAFNNKIYVFTDDLIIQPGRSLVIQYVKAATTDTNWTIKNGITFSGSLPIKPHIGFIYKRGGVVEDAIPFNDVANSELATSWTSLNVPNYVWNGESISFEGNVAGVVRTGFSGTINDWNLSSDIPMSIGTTNKEWIRFENGNCEGEVSVQKITVIDPPTVELEVGEPIVPDGGCGLSDEIISVKVRNYGVENVSNVKLNYTIGNDTISETLTSPIVGLSDTLYTFVNTPNLAFDKDSLVTVKVWVSAIEEDPMRINDTNKSQILSLYTPKAPDTTFTRYVQYATQDTISIDVPSGVVPVWYDYNMDAIDTGNIHITERIYLDGTCGVGYMVMDSMNVLVGDTVETNSSNGFPGPYQTINKYNKQQYLYTASDLASYGLRKGEILSMAFSAVTMPNSLTEINYLNYTIAIAQVPDTLFETVSSWIPTTKTVFFRDTLVVKNENTPIWISHDFDKPVLWDGESSLLVQVSYELEKTNTGGVKSYWRVKNNSALYKNSNAALLPSTFEFTSAGTKANYLPVVQFRNVAFGCLGYTSPYNVVVEGIPNVDVSIAWPQGFDTLRFSSCENVSLPIEICNQGLETISEVKLYYEIDGMEVDSTVLTDTYSHGDVKNSVLFDRPLTPGIHSVKVIVNVDADSITSNDTLCGNVIVRFCGGEYSINSDGSGDYISLKEAVDKLNEVGLNGAVTFNVHQGEYNEAVAIHDFYGSSASNTLTIMGQVGSQIMATPNELDNYVLLIDGASHVILKNMHMLSIPENKKTKGNVVVLNKTSDVTIDSCTLTVMGNITDTAASCIVVRKDVNNLRVLNSEMDSGGYSINCGSESAGNSAITIQKNKMLDFARGGIRLCGVERLNLSQNILKSGNSGNGTAANARGLIGIFVASTKDSVRIVKNTINLIDENNTAKRGIHVERVSSTMLNPAYIANNMISTYGTNTNGLTPSRAAGIWVDSISSYVNVFFNTVQVYTTSAKNANANAASYSFYAGPSVDHLQVMNNIFSNTSYGYAYYVSEKGTVVSSNFNAYYTLAEKKYAWSNTEITSLSELQVENADDGNSLEEEPFFVSNEDLHLLKSNFVEKGQYNAEVFDDIDGNMRQQMPAPTIGAQEMSRAMHDMAIIRVIEPKLPSNVNSPYNIETDSVRVIATICNNGMMTETGVVWYAYVEGYEEETRSISKNIGTFSPMQVKTDTLMMPTKVGILYYQKVNVVVESSLDTINDNDTNNAPVYLSPAYNVAAKKVKFDGGCNLKKVPITLEIKNEGVKAIPSGSKLTIGYHAEVSSPKSVVISTLPDTVEEEVTLSSALASGSSLELNFSTNANLYPTDTAIDISVKVVGWCKYRNDILVNNDTTSGSGSAVKDSYFTPTAPKGHDTTFSYGTWGSLTAEQENSLPIRWYRDTTQNPFHKPAQYTPSTIWSPTPQYFNDSVYYLNCISSKKCTSEYSQFKVKVASRIARDMAMESVITPIGKRVYMENDTVRIKVSNYGTSAQGTIPVTYELKKNGTTIQTVTEYIPSVGAGQTVDYTFSTLLDLPDPTVAQNFNLNVYTDLTNDGSRKNDTLRTAYTFSTYAQDRYNNFSEHPSTDKTTRFDITRFSFSDIDLEMPALDRDYTNLAEYTNIDYPTLHVRRGMTDSVLLEVSTVTANAPRVKCRASISIDYNRDGYFNDLSSPCVENVIVDVPFYSDSVFRSAITIPMNAELGHMRMRVKVMGIDSSSVEGHIIDFMLFVDADALSKDLAFTQLASPRSPLVYTDDSVSVAFRMDNRGKNVIDSVTIFYKFFDKDFHYNGAPIIDTIVTDSTVYYDTVGYDSTGIGVYHWVGPLASGQSTVVKLPGRVFAVGNTMFSVWHNLNGDLKRNNDTLNFEYHKFPEITLTYKDDFESLDYWYAPQGKTEYDYNYWQLGKPNKTRINTVYSGNNAWVTDLNNTVVTGRRGNVSYLYSPVIDLSQTLSDTIRFRMLRNITGGSTVHVEIYNYLNQWQKLDRDSVLTWYNDEENHAFTGTSPSGDGYASYVLSTTGTNGPAGNFNSDRFQIRFVYTTPIGSNSGAAFGEGCAVDDFEVIRARIAQDGGVVAISYPESPRYGNEVYPKLIVKNFGTDTLRNFKVGYTYYGSPLAKISDVSAVIPPDMSAEISCSNPFIVTSDFPEVFSMTAFTIIDNDKYKDNDTTAKMVPIMPLDDDISADSILAPLEKVVAGDSTVLVTLRIHNFGFNDIHEVRTGYFVNDVLFTEEIVNFDSVLGRPLSSLEYYNYTYKQCMTPSLGTNSIKCYVKINSDSVHTYEYNDTVTKRIQGQMSVVDLAATGIILDRSHVGEVRVVVTIENKGTVAANNFKLGYMIDGDTSTTIIETFKQAEPIKALSTGTHSFDYVLLDRPKPYDSIIAFVMINDDNDPSNDTTSTIITAVPDIEVIKLVVEENSASTCRVFMQIKNVGQAPLTKQMIRMHAVINGDSIMSQATPETVLPGQTMHLLFFDRVPKSPQRIYEGEGFVDAINGDTNHTNEQTSIVELVNYVDGIEEVAEALFSLGQNYPNPFTGQTMVPFSLAEASDVKIVVMNTLGRYVLNTQKFFPQGDHVFLLDMIGYPSGIYYYGIEVNGIRQIKKMILK